MTERANAKAVSEPVRHALLKLLAICLGVSFLVAAGAVTSAQAEETFSISGTAYLGTKTTPAGAGEVLVHWGTNAEALPATGVLTNGWGEFTIPGLAMDSAYYLWFEYKGSGAFDSVFVPGVATSSEAESISMEGGDVSNIAGVLPAHGALRGRVTEFGTSRGFGNVEITAYTQSGSAWVPAGSLSYADTDGYYSIDGLSAGRYKIGVRNLGYYPLQSGYFGGGSFLATAAITDFAGAGDTALRIVGLVPTQNITGIVSLGSTATPAGASEVSVSATYYDPDLLQTVTVPSAGTTYSSGKYWVTNLDKATTYTLNYRYRGTGLVGYLESSVQVSTGTIEQTTKNVTLARANTVAGRVRLGESGPFAAAGEVTVTLARASGLSVTATTTSTGDFVANTLEPGTYTVSFHYTGAGDYPDYSLASTITVPGDATGISVTMPHGTTISGNVTRNGHAVRDTSVVAHRVDPDTGTELGQYSATSNAYGQYAIKAVDDGWYWVEFIASNYAYQTWGGGNKYEEPDLFEVVSGADNNGKNATLFYSAEISGDIVAADNSDWTPGAFTVELFRNTGSAWVSTGEIVSASSSRSYLIHSLPPGDYRLSVVYNGSLGRSQVVSPTIVVGDADEKEYDPILPRPFAAVTVGTLVKSDSSPTIYLVDSDTRLVPLATIASATDAGVSTAVQTVPQSQIDFFSIDPKPLSNVIFCHGNESNAYLATGGKLVRIDPALATAWAHTNLTGETCSTLPGEFLTPQIWEAAYVGSAGGQVFRVGPEGRAQPVSGLINSGALLFDRIKVHTVNSTFIASLPQGGPILLPGTLLKATGSSVVYLSNGNHLVPITNTATVSDLGLSTAIRSVLPTFLDSYVIDTQPLLNLVLCGNEWLFIGAEGKLYDVLPSVVTGMQKSLLGSETCYAMPQGRSDYGYITTALLLKSPSAATIYYVNPSGQKQAVLQWSQVVSLSLPRAPLYLTVNATYLTTIPTGADVVTPGSVLSSGGALYLATDASNLVPLRSPETLGDFGLPSPAIAVSAATITSRTVAPQPLSNFVLCGGDYFYASAGALHRTDLATTGGAIVSELAPAVCGRLTWDESTLGKPLFLKAPTASTIFVLADGKKRAIVSWATVVRLAGANPIVITTVSSAFLNALSTGPDLIDAGSLVKSASSPTVYLVNDATHFVPVRTFDSITELGLSTAVATVSAGTITAATIDSAPLSNFVICGGNYYYAANGVLNVSDSATVGSAPVTSLTTALCALLPKNTSTAGKPVFLKSPAAPTVYLLDSGVKRAVLSMASLTRLAGAGPLVISTVNAAFLATVPAGGDVIDAGMLVKSASSPTVYLVNDATHLIPLRTFDSITELGLPTAYVTVSAGTISAMSVDTAPLSNLVSCNGETWVATAGKLSKVTTGIVGSLPVTSLSTTLCAVLPKNAGTLTAPLFVKSPSAPTVFALDAGVKSPIGAWASVVRLAGSNPIVITTLNAAYLATVPTGPDVLETGGLVKSASSPTVYVVDGSGGIIPLASFQSVTDLGLSTAYATVSAATISALTVAPAPLASLVSCDGEKWIAGQGKLWKTTTASTGTLTVQTLPASLCAVIPKSATSLSTPSLIKSTSSPTIYALDNGVKKPVASWATVLTLTGGAGTYVATNPAFIATIPTGAGI